MPTTKENKQATKSPRKPLSASKAKKRAWDAFSKFIRLRDALKTTRSKDEVVCYTCYKTYPAFGMGCAQAGHFIPGRGNSVLLDEIGVNAQCYNCNVNLRGNWVEYEKHLLNEYGAEEVERLKGSKNQIQKKLAYEWLELEEEYKNKYEELLRLC